MSSWLRYVLIWLALTAHAQTVDAASDDAKRKSANGLLKEQFHRKKTGRKWKKGEDTDEYRRYQCETVYNKDNIDWHISIHVHPQQQKQLDRIYAFEYSGGSKQAFMGAVQRLGLWTDFDLVRQDDIARPSCKTFCNRYEFETDGKIVVIQNFVNGYALRVDPEDYPKNAENLDTRGGLGVYSKWKVQLTKKGSDRFVKFRNEKSGKYLRITNVKSGQANVAGTGDELTLFKVHRLSGDYYRFESNKYPGKFLRVSTDAKTAGVGEGTRNWSKFKVYKET